MQLDISTAGTLRFLALGDSYTIGEAVSPVESWPVQLTRRLSDYGYPFADPVIIATTGWRTDELRQAILQRNLSPSYDVVSLLIGVNNQYQGKSIESYETEFTELLSMAIHLAGSKTGNVIVLSIPDYGFTPFGEEKQEQISRSIDAFNGVNMRIAQKAGVNYVDITPLTREGLRRPTLIAADGLHPSAVMYAEWVNAILSEVSFTS